jgi:MFS family permease
MDSEIVKGAPVTPKKNWLNKNILGMGLASFFSDMNHEMASSVLPAFLSSVLGAPAFALGLIEGVADGISTLFEVWSGWYSDKIGKRKGLTVIGYAITAFSEASFALATNWWHILIGRTTGWIGWSIRSPVRDALLLESTTKETVGRAFAFHRTMDTLGAIAGPLIATLLLSRVPIRTIFLVSLIPGICAVLSLIFFVKEKAKKPDTRNSLQSIRNLPKNFLSFLVPVGLFGISNFAPTLLILRAQDLLTPEHGTVLAVTFSVGLYTFSNIMYAMVSYPIGVMADKFNKKTILAIGYFIFGIMCIGFIFANHSLWYLIVLFALSGFYTAIIESSQPALASTLFNEDQHGTDYGVLSAVDGLGDFLSSITVGLLWTYLSPSVGFAFGGILAIVAGIIMIFLKFKTVPLKK